jgi:hypothetical protein
MRFSQQCRDIENRFISSVSIYMCHRARYTPVISPRVREDLCTRSPLSIRSFSLASDHQTSDAT